VSGRIGHAPQTGCASPLVTGRCWRHCCTGSRGMRSSECTWWRPDTPGKQRHELAGHRPATCRPVQRPLGFPVFRPHCSHLAATPEDCRAGHALRCVLARRVFRNFAYSSWGHATRASASTGRSTAIRQLASAPASRAPARARTTASTITPVPTEWCSGTGTVWIRFPPPTRNSPVPRGTETVA